MKNAKNIFTALFLLISISAFAKNDIPSVIAKINKPLTAYINAVTKGKITGLSEHLDPSVKNNISTNEKLITLNKSEFLSQIKHSENIEQNCTSSYEILETSANQAIIKIQLKYVNFIKNNIVTLNNTDKGWKITNISTSFE